MNVVVWVLAAVSVMLLGGCHKEPPPSDPAFDKLWAEVSRAVPETAYIEDDRAAGLMGKIERAPQVAPEPLRAGDTLPGKLDMSEISRTIRSNLGAVKVCYLREQRITARSGKAIVTFSINSDGTVGEVDVNAPAFRGTNLPKCIGEQIKRMTFPKFQEGPQSVSYPFVFVGS